MHSLRPWSSPWFRLSRAPEHHPARPGGPSVRAASRGRLWGISRALLWEGFPRVSASKLGRYHFWL